VHRKDRLARLVDRHGAVVYVSFRDLRRDWKQVT
jgi:hypothetical protein